ncbi:MAG: hypothetical protein ILO36_06345, partial [Abditibacteriota bacterium]|nr:hypothetical protein [Abditibacteriota bacterium]
FMGAGNGMTGRNYGLPRFRECRFGSRFPFAYVSLRDKTNPVTCRIRAFSPFVPGNEDDSSLPFAAAEYTFENTSQAKQNCVFYFSALQFMGVEGGEDRLFVESLENGFLFRQEKTEKQGSEGAFCVVCDTPARVDSVLYDNDSWLAGLDTMTMLWNNIAKGEAAVRKNENGRSPGASLAAPFALEPGEKKSIAVRFAWYVPESDQQIEGGGAFYEPWYAGRYGDIYEAEKDFALRYAYFEEEAERFAREFEKQTLPEAALEAAEANLSILKTPTLLRQKDGRLWGWEGLCDTFGSCHGSCSHVYNYAQALCSLFPRLEQSLRDTEFEEDQDENGHQQFRTLLPIRPNSHNFHAASDGQPGGIMKLYRE